ncbi:MAG: DUF2470 domain-containing protein [Mycolicibacterium sp.]|uniref:DUF2470 domain-containing protein n=1 Tax=Mycolicibacterium sp. TaxID=2320850 RepID=UPI003D153047
MAIPSCATTPSTAERVRSACARGAGAMLAAEGLDPAPTPLHHLLDDGSFAVTLPADGALVALVEAAGDRGVQAMLEMADIAPLPLREPVRALVWIGGRLRHVPAHEVSELLDLVAASDPNPALLQVTALEREARHALMRLEIESLVVADSAGAESVAPGALLRARPDPFCAMESCWLQHMDSAHREVVDRIAGRLPASLRRGRVRPLGLDRYGLQLRIEGEDRDHDVRLSFDRPVDDVAGLSRAIRALVGCPFRNGLTTRRP